MSTLDGFLLKILNSAPSSKQAIGQMNIIALQPYDYLVTDIQRVFKEQEDVKVRLDRRYSQRRTKKVPFSDERRQADRRKTKETLVDVVISI